MHDSSMDPPIYVLNGPNLNRLGKREPDIYGATTLAEIEAMCRTAAGSRPVEFRQSNAEFQLVDWIHEAIDVEAAGIVINPAGLTFTSVPIYDALKMFPGPIFELHISNIYRREDVYRNSLMSRVATAVIMGLGADGYRTAIEAMLRGSIYRTSSTGAPAMTNGVPAGPWSGSLMRLFRRAL